MAGHYFEGTDEGDDSLRHDFTLTVGDHVFPWRSMGGVFSCRKADRGGLLLLEGLLELAVSGEVLDLGCGHGQVGLPLARLRPDVSLTMVDVNSRALASAKANGERLGLRGVRYLVSDGVSALSPELRFRWVALNPPVRAGKDTVHALVDGAWERIEPGGGLVVVLRVKQGGWTLFDRLVERLDEEAAIVLRKKGYLVMAALRRAEEGRSG